MTATISHNVQAFSIPQTEQTVNASRLAYIQLRATEGEAEAQFLLGLMYLSGRFVDPDLQQGRMWLLNAAEQGHLKAAKTIADLAFDGKIIDQDLSLAEHWYQQLAVEGDKWAEFRLGFIYAAGGKGIERNCGKAVDHFLSVGDEVSLGNVVWILSTCPEPEYRNGDRAIEIGKGLVEANEQDPTNLDNLAAAYAEIGDYTAAIHTQKRAIEALKHSSQLNRFDEFERRLQKYQQQQPYREVVSLTD
ncbi:sel1 repeat family protein [Shewanella sp. Isolate11]|nr:tetratricopeptide repeat protein [Shewanella sp. Isolate11]MCG9697526.1 sel1 repeat family protein [Shewanella sp. Isolate11]